MYNIAGDERLKELFLEKFWGKPISIPILVLLYICGAAAMLSNINDNLTSIIVQLSIYFILIIIYVIYVIHENSLPRCNKNEIGVLFIFKTATDEQYNDFKYIVEENFRQKIGRTKVKITPICINASKLKKYDRDNKKYMRSLLLKVNCDFCIEFFIEANSLNNPTKYSTTIHTGVLHPDISKEATDSLMNKLSFGAKPIRKIDFDCNNKLNALKAITNYLRDLSEYIIGLLLIMYNDNKNAVSVLENLFNIVPNNHKLHPLISDALYEAAIREASRHSEEHTRTGKKLSLLNYEKHIELANLAIPDRYVYHLNMATIDFLKYRNISSAKSHIKRCKELNDNDHWKYSEAFLLAYETDDPNIVYSKYMHLINNTYNVMNIINFIEKILEIEPDKVILHLALGLLYYNNNDKALANCHLKQFLHTYNNKITIRKKILEDIKNKTDSNLCSENMSESSCNNCLLLQESA